jgi:hypothetical protein
VEGIVSETLRALIEHASAAIEPIFKNTGQIMPMWHCVKGDGSQFAFQHPPCADRDMNAALVRTLLEIVDAQCCLFISEAWTAKLDADEADKFLAQGGKGASDHPRRVEIVMFSGEDENGQLLARRHILRPAIGKATLGPLTFDDYNISEGRLVGMLPRRGATVQ